MSGYKNNDEREEWIFDYTTGTEFQRIRKQRANRKEHNCYYCKGKIEKDKPSFYYSGKWRDLFYYFHVCMKCEGEDPIV